MSVSEILAELAVDTPSQAIPRSSRDAAAKMLLDTCGCAFCGMEAPGIPELIDLEHELGAVGNASVYFHEMKMALPSAVLCNAAMIHALDFDNNYNHADIHIMSIVVPIAFACCEATGDSGHNCLNAIILGVESASRIAKPYVRARRSHKYFLTTSLVGGWGGVATAARLLGLSTKQTVHAMGIYYAHTCGNRQALLERALTKRIQPAIAAKAAIYSVLLAQRGISGPEFVFEGKAGFYACYTRDPSPPEEEFASPAISAVQELSVKQFPTCGVHHANIASALYLKHEQGFTCEQIKRVEFFLNEGGGTLVSMPFALSKIPQIDAQFCAPYAIALALNKGRVAITDFNPQQILDDQNTLDLAQRTSEHARFANMRLKHYSQPRPGYKYTKVTLHDGRVFEHEHPSAPLNDPSAMNLAQVRDKFKQCVSMYAEVDPGVSEHLADAILDFEDVSSVSEFIAAILRKTPIRRPFKNKGHTKYRD